MSIDFFKGCCAESVRTDLRFGLCDDVPNSKAYSNDSNSSKWIATVVNPNATKVTFTPIDNCTVVLKPGTGRPKRESSCDGMLTFFDTIFLVELKDRNPKKATRANNKGKKQIKNTIILLRKYHGKLLGLTKKRAYVSNKQMLFTTVSNAESKRFRDETGGFTLYKQTEILLP